jgi:type I restriction enzyme, S subunit
MTVQEVQFESLYATKSRNGIYKPANFHGRGTKIINMGELFGFDFIGDQPMERVDLTTDELNKSGLEDGDLLFGRRSLIEAGAGKCSIVVAPSEPLTFESSIIRVRLNRKEVEPKYLYYYFRSPRGRGRIAAIVTGTNVKGIRGSDLARISVEVPKRAIQQRICGMLGNYDSLIVNNVRRMQLLEQSARLLFREWFVHLRYPGHEHIKLADGVPKGWRRQLLRDIASTNSESFSAKSLPPEINYIDISSVQSGRILHRTRMRAEEAPGRARRRVKDGDVIWSNVRPNLRQFALVVEPDETDVVSTGFTTLTPKTVPSSFLYVAVTTDAFVAHLVNHTTGSSYPAVRPEDFESAEVLVPTWALLEDFNSQCEAMFRLAHRLEAQNRKLAAARDLLLPRLMDGRISV